MIRVTPIYSFEVEAETRNEFTVLLTGAGTNKFFRIKWDGPEHAVDFGGWTLSQHMSGATILKRGKEWLIMAAGMYEVFLKAIHVEHSNYQTIKTANEE